jgi:hypothetical protein
VLFCTARRNVACGGTGKGTFAAPPARAEAAAKGAPATAIKAAAKKPGLKLRMVSSFAFHPWISANPPVPPTPAPEYYR